MTLIRIAVIDPSNPRRERKLEVPNDVPVNKLINAIQQALGLSADDKYRLEPQSLEKPWLNFDPNRTLEQNRISTDEVFRLVPKDKSPDRIRLGLAISSPWGGHIRYETILVNPHDPVWEVINTIGQSLNLERVDASGNTLAYHFEQRGERLPMTTSLSEWGVNDNTVLDLVVEPIQLTQFKNFWREAFNQDPPMLLNIESFQKIGPIMEVMESSGITNDVSQYYVRRIDMYNILASYLDTGIKEDDKINQLLRTVTRAREEERLQILNARPEKILAATAHSFLSSPKAVPTQKASQLAKASGSWEEGKFIITAQVPETIATEKVFQIEIVISFRLELLHWMTVENKTPVNFDITLFSPDLLILGPKVRQVSIPMMPGEHQIHTSLPAMCNEPGKVLINLQFFQRGRYIGELEVETNSQANKFSSRVQEPVSI